LGFLKIIKFIILKKETMEEQFFQCPYCWQNISILLDPSVAEQTFIEDCEVCCQPIEITISFEDNEMSFFEAKSIEQ
jgi:hypothetical protein